MPEKFSSEEEELKSLITDVTRMQQTLKNRISRLNAAVDAIETGWKGSAAKQYDETQRKANLYAQKLDRQLQYMEEVLKMSKDGFTGEELRQVGDYKALAAKSPISDFTDSSPSVK